MNRQQQEFVRSMTPHAQRVSARTGLDPRLVIAQAAQETGWGQNAPNNNYFGIKSHGEDGGVLQQTTEYQNGQPTTVNDSFRTYDGPGQSADDYAEFVSSNPRYRDMLGAEGLDAQVAALGESGYATDPNYANSVGSIARGIELPGGHTSMSTSGALGQEQQLPPVNVPQEGDISTGVLDGQNVLPMEDARLANAAIEEANAGIPEGQGQQGPRENFGNNPLPPRNQGPQRQEVPFDLHDPRNTHFMDENGDWQPKPEVNSPDASASFNGPSPREDRNARRERELQRSVGPTANLSSGESDPVLSTSGQEQEDPSIWDRITGARPDWLTEDRSEMLLGIGAGLLSGDDWASGIAGASENMLSIGQTQEEQELARQEAERIANSSNTYNRPYNISGIDPETGMEVVRSGTKIDGVDYIEHNGEMVPATQVLEQVSVGTRGNQDVREGAGGIPNAVHVSQSGMPSFNFRRESEAKNYSYAVRAIGAHRDLDRIINEVGEEEITSLRTGLERWAANNSNSSISGATLNSVINESGLSGAAASTMSAYLQAILRADTGAAYTGTEIADYASAFLPSPGDNPETQEQKRRLRERELIRFAGMTGSASPYVSGLIDGEYEMPGGYWEAPQGNTQSGTQTQSSGSGNSDMGYDPDEIDRILQENGA